MAQPVPPPQQQIPQQAVPVLHALWAQAALNPERVVSVGVALGLAAASYYALDSYLIATVLLALLAYASFILHWYFYSFLVTTVGLVLYGYRAEILFSLSEDLLMVGVSAGSLLVVAGITFEALKLYAKIRGHNNPEAPNVVWVTAAVLGSLSVMVALHYFVLPASPMLWKVQCASRLSDPSRYPACVPKCVQTWCSYRPSLNEIRERYKAQTKSIVGQERQLEYYTTLVLGYFSELHRGGMAAPREPLTILSAGLHALGKNQLNWHTAIAFNRIDECNTLLYPSVGYVGPNYAQCVRMHGVLQLSGEVLKKAAAKEGQCHIMYEEIAAWLQDTVRCGYIPILNLEEIQLYPNVGQCLIPLINGDQISVAGSPPFTMANSLILMTANTEVPLLAPAQEIIVRRAREDKEPASGLALDRFFQDLNDESALPVLISKLLFANAEGTTDWFKWKITTIPFFPHTEASLVSMATHRFMAAIEKAGVIACWKEKDDSQGYFSDENSDLPFPCKGIEEVAKALVKEHVEPLRERFASLHAGSIDEGAYALWVRYNARAVITQVERMIEDFLATKASVEAKGRPGEILGLKLTSAKNPPELDFVIVDGVKLHMLHNVGGKAIWPSPKKSVTVARPSRTEEGTGNKNNSTAPHVPLDTIQANSIPAVPASGV